MRIARCYYSDEWLFRFEGAIALSAQLKYCLYILSELVGSTYRLCRTALWVRRVFIENSIASTILKLISISSSKLLRANGGCLGVWSRRRTWVAAISHGELSTEH